MAVKEHRPAVKRMKKGSSFFGYTDTSWNAGVTDGEKGDIKNLYDRQQKMRGEAHNMCTVLTGQQLPICCFCASWVGVK